MYQNGLVAYTYSCFERNSNFKCSLLNFKCAVRCSYCDLQVSPISKMCPCSVIWSIFIVLVP